MLQYFLFNSFHSYSQCVFLKNQFRINSNLLSGHLCQKDRHYSYYHVCPSSFRVTLTFGMCHCVWGRGGKVWCTETYIYSTLARPRSENMDCMNSQTFINTNEIVQIISNTQCRHPLNSIS